MKRFRVTRLSIAAMVLVAAVACAGLAAALNGCAGELPVPGQTSSTVARPATSTTESQVMALAKQVSRTWQEGVQSVVAVIQDVPAVDSVRPAVTALRDTYIQKMLTLGSQIATLPASDREECYSRVTDSLSAQAGTDWFVRYKAIYEQYTARSDQATQEFAVLLSTFNVLADYAFFDVLKVNEPEEATRLSIP
jgi:hypothetical protein